jgi:hypothetical protein
MSDEIIAHRKFALGEDRSSTVEVFLFRPVPDDKDFRCEYEIRKGDNTIRRSYALGVDTLQALTLALEKLGADILFSKSGQEKALFWNEQNADLGLILPKRADTE